MNLSVTHTSRKGNFKSVVRINCTKILLFYQILCITKQETQSEVGCGREKPRLKG